ncbi:protein adenylyltransferase SelO [Paramylibacter ulvae]|uniref:protein adenylyltransferase SelO n=1 Tax=Paramylibacter ulvae TaxID=1651968 RepID=UPI0027E58E9F|nr:YdiU family protein [Amylibacter ulvae]
MDFHFDNTYARELDGFYVQWQGDSAPDAKIVKFNHDLAFELGLDADALNSSDGAAIFAGTIAPTGASPLAQAYAGHQFGGFSPQLGDGRAILLGEIIAKNGTRQDLHLKGSGRTPFSRGGDGKAVLGPVLREYMMGEAMHALNIPTTRALAAVTTGEDILREGYQPGAVLARIASSHLRVGTFQFFAARQENEKLRQLADYAIHRHYPDMANANNPYIALLQSVCAAQAELVAKWMLVGFVHGVMNTDNMTISGETIDYGPCAFIDQYAIDAVYSSIDANGRYAYGNQPKMAKWNLARLAESLLPLIDQNTDRAIEIATVEINKFDETYARHWVNGMRAKIGLSSAHGDDEDLINQLFTSIENQRVDFTQLFRALANATSGNNNDVFALVPNSEGFRAWVSRWQERLTQETINPEERVAAMNAVNPLYIPRNHLVEGALTAAVNDGDMNPFDDLLAVLKHPFTPQSNAETYAKPAPTDFGPYKTFCGT